jgi:hypothetical protein
MQKQVQFKWKPLKTQLMDFKNRKLIQEEKEKKLE